MCKCADDAIRAKDDSPRSAFGFELMMIGTLIWLAGQNTKLNSLCDVIEVSLPHIYVVINNCYNPTTSVADVWTQTK